MLKDKHENVIHKHGKQQHESHKFVLNLSQRLDLRSSTKHVVLQSLSINYMWKNIKKQYENNKHGMMSLNYQIVLILYRIFKIISSILLKSMNIDKHFSMFTSIKLIID